jgi:hypothetical protein
MGKWGNFLRGRAQALGQARVPRQRESDHRSCEARKLALALVLAPSLGEWGRAWQVPENVPEEG